MAPHSGIILLSILVRMMWWQCLGEERAREGVEGRRLEAITNIIIAKARKIRGFNNLLALANPMLGVSLFMLI